MTPSDVVIARPARGCKSLRKYLISATDFATHHAMPAQQQHPSNLVAVPTHAGILSSKYEADTAATSVAKKKNQITAARAISWELPW
eukprot:CAMPEP_0198524856 /NCGR_PEP_ID=MMETSP1462-20131121/23001_1 /TAXON_ID=1333877 /ORGANISM="Brandtodinium nutriculum, Strain RCC3387" /LENGTH=86 /DNA_ID=CAMNT_0044254599 /DNA_START=292 /DNA_END=552 /DNA_ORIENTATION=+